MVFAVKEAKRCPLTADIFPFCNVLDKLSVKLQCRWPRQRPKKKSNVFIYALPPIILDLVSASKGSLRQSPHYVNSKQ